MEGFNWWGAFSFVMPLALVMIIGLMLIITSFLGVIAKLIKGLGGKHGKID